MSKYDKYLTNGAVNKYAKYAEDPEKTFNQLESGLLGIRTGASLGTSDEAAGGRAARAQLLPKWANRAFEGTSGGLPIVQAVQGAIDLGIGLTVENAPQFRDTQARRSYEAARDSDRLINETSRADNPYSMLAGELIGGIATGPPIATGAKSIKTVAAEAGKRAVDLTAKAQKVTSATQKAALLKKAADAQAKAVRLARPASTMGEAAGRLGSQAVAGGVKGGAVGTLYGAGYGFGNAEGKLEDRAQGAASGALIGGIGGAILTPAVQGLAKVGGEIVYKVRTPAEMKALDMVLKRAERSGTELRAVKTQFDEWSKTGEVPETLAELMGPNERSLLSALVTVNRETREQAAGVFVGRGKEEVNRLEDAFSKSFGAGRGDYQKTKVAAQQARAKEAEPFYEGAYVDAATGQRKFLGQPETDALVYEVGGSRVAQSTLSTASDYADALGQRAIRDEIDDFARAIKAGGPVKPLSVQAADYVERGINRRYGAASKGEAQDIPAGLKGLRDRVRAIIDPSGLGDARAVAREAIRRGELLDEGLGIMSPTVDVDDVEAVMRGLPDAGIPAASDAGRTAYGVGASRAVANKLRNVPDMAGFADAARTVARTPALRDKLEAARPKVLTKSGAENKGSRQTKANAALDQAIERASDRAQFGVDMVGNSKTAFRQGDVEDALMDDAMSTQAGELIGDLLISGAGGVTQRLQDKLGRSIGNRLGQPSIYRPRINREAANILLATGEQIPIQIARIAKRAAERANGRSRALPIAPPAGAAPAGAPVPPPPPIRASGFTGLRTDAGNAAVGAGLGALGPADSNEERLRNMAIGAGVGIAGGSRTVGKALGVKGDDVARTAGVGGSGSGNAGRFRFGPTGKAFNPYSRQVQDEIIRTSGGTVTERNIEDLMSVYTDDLLNSTPQEIVDNLRRQAGEIPMSPRDVEYAGFAELMARQLTPMRPDKAASPILTAGAGGGRKPPKPDSPEAIRESVRKVSESIRAKGINAKPQPSEMRVGKGMSKLTGIKDDPAMSMNVASDMLKAGRSPDEIWTATQRLPIKIEGRTILVRGAGKTPEDVQAGFWQEMAKPYSKRASWAQKGTEGIFPMGSGSIARQPLDDRLNAVAKRLSTNRERIPRRDIWEETGVVVITRGQDGQMVTGKAYITNGFEPVALMDAKQFKTFDEAQAYLDSIPAMPRADQPDWYRKNFSQVLDAGSLRRLGKGEVAARRVGEQVLKHPRVVGFAAGSAIGASGVIVTDAELKRRQAATR